MKLMILLIVNTSAIAVLTVVLAIGIFRMAGIRRLLSAGFISVNEKFEDIRLRKLVKKYKRAASVRISPAEKIELYIIDKSNIRRYIPFMNVSVLMLITIAIFAGVFGPVYRVLYFVPSTVVICVIIALIPSFILDIMGRYNTEVVRRGLAEFISVLNRWCAVKEDIFYAFEKSVASGLGEPLESFVRDMVIQVNRGIEPLEALDLLQLKVDSPQFRDFIINIKQNIRHRGDIRKLLTNLENQFYKIEEEYNRRKISTYKDRLVLNFVMFGVLLTGYAFLKLNPDVEWYYLQTMAGKLLLTLFSLLYASGFYLSFRITRFRH